MKKTSKKNNNYDYTANERKMREREKMKKLEIKRKELYAHEDDWEEIKKFSDEKLKRRLNNY